MTTILDVDNEWEEEQETDEEEKPSYADDVLCLDEDTSPPETSSDEKGSVETMVGDTPQVKKRDRPKQTLTQPIKEEYDEDVPPNNKMKGKELVVKLHLDLSKEETGTYVPALIMPEEITVDSSAVDVQVNELIHYECILSRLRASWKFVSSIDDVCKLAVTTDKMLDSRHLTLRKRSRDEQEGKGGGGLLTPYNE